MPQTAVTIRPLTENDHAEWRRMWCAYLAFYETELPDHVYDSTFSRLLSDDPHEFSGLIARRGETPVGLTHFLFHRHAWKVENTCYLQDLWCEPAARGTGCGRALIEAVYAEADKKGAPAVYWLTQHFNTPGRHLYDRVGKLSDFIRYQRP